MFVCDKNYSCCDFQYWDNWDNVEQEAKECGHLIETAPVVHAKWIRNNHDILVCSNCKNEPLLNEEGYWCESAFCPHCGADMN